MEKYTLIGNEEIKEYISEIVKLAFQINTETEHDVFVYFWGYTNTIEVYFCKGGWKLGKEKDYRNDFRLESCYKEDFEKIIEKLKELLKKNES
jgi:hypothetical protein